MDQDLNPRPPVPEPNEKRLLAELLNSDSDVYGSFVFGDTNNLKAM